MGRLKDLIFFVTRRCDLRCRTCFYAGEIDRGGAELSLNEIDAVASRLGRLDSLFISGGEPFLRQDLAEICAVFHRRCGTRSIHLPSNGQEPGRIRTTCAEIMRRVPGLRLTLSLPLDGRESVHDRLKDAPGSFRRTAATARGLSPLRREYPSLRLYVITVVCRENLHDILPLAAWLEASLDIDGHGPSPLRGRPRDPGLSPPTAAAWRELAEGLRPFQRRWLEREAFSRLRRALALNRWRYLNGVYARVLSGGGLPFRCLAGERIAVLEPDGDVRLCELTSVVGNVRRSGLDLLAVLDGEQARQGRRQARRCACTHACFIESSIRSQPLARAFSLSGRPPAPHG